MLRNAADIYNKPMDVFFANDHVNFSSHPTINMFNITGLR